MRVCIVASTRFPIREPFAGGLEAMTHSLSRHLLDRGHEVTVFAAPGSDPDLPLAVLPVDAFEASEQAARDPHAPSAAWMAEHHAYLGLMLALGRSGRDRFDVVHNNSLHHLPVAMADVLSIPLVTTLHTPPLPWLESAITLARGSGRFAAVSEHTAAAWAHAVDSTTVLNGVDTALFTPGPGGGPPIWSGRLVAEKAPHEAIDACRLAGLPLDLVGPISDPAYFEREVRPRLGDGVDYRGHLTHHDLRTALGAASVAISTPAWDEPFGLAAAEAMACGTPVAGYARGALPEFVGPDAGVLVGPGDLAALAGAIGRAATLERRQVRRHAVFRCSTRRMVDGYEELYRALVREYDDDTGLPLVPA